MITGFGFQQFHLSPPLQGLMASRYPGGHNSMIVFCVLSLLHLEDGTWLWFLTRMTIKLSRFFYTLRVFLHPFQG